MTTNPNAKYVVTNEDIIAAEELDAKNDSKSNNKTKTITKANTNTNTKNSKPNSKSPKSKAKSPKSSTKSKPAKKQTKREAQRAKAKAEAKAKAKLQEIEDEAEIAKFQGKKATTNTDTEITKSNSSYYLYRSTNAEEAEKYKPKKIEPNSNTNSNSNSNNNNSNNSNNSSGINSHQKQPSASGASVWNTGATMEQFDYSKWAHTRVKQLLLDLVFPKHPSLQITEVTKCEGSATILFMRGRFRPGYDITFESKWKCKIDGHVGKGSLNMTEITSEDDSDDWEFEARIKKRSKANKAALKIMEDSRENVIQAIQQFVQELRAKKQC